MVRVKKDFNLKGLKDLGFYEWNEISLAGTKIKGYRFDFQNYCEDKDECYVFIYDNKLRLVDLMTDERSFDNIDEYTNLIFDLIKLDIVEKYGE